MTGQDASPEPRERALAGSNAAGASERTVRRNLSAKRWWGTAEDLQDLIHNITGAVSDFAQQDARVTYGLAVGEEEWRPPDSDAFLRDLPDDAITSLKRAEARIVAGDADQHSIVLKFTTYGLSVDLESNSPLFISALARFSEDAMRGGEPPWTWHIPTAIFTLGWLFTVGAIPWIVVQFENSGRFESPSFGTVFAPIGIGLVLFAIGGIVRSQMPPIELQTAGAGQPWDRFRGRIWRGLLWLVPIVISLVLYFVEREDGVQPTSETETAARDVNGYYVGFALSNDFWLRPPRLSEESRSYLVRNWGSLDPREAHPYRPVGSESVDLDELYSRTGLDGTSMRVKGYVTEVDTEPVNEQGGVRQSYELGVRGQDARLTCISTAPEADRIRLNDYVSVIVVPAARGMNRDDGRGTFKMTLALCPASKVLPRP